MKATLTTVGMSTVSSAKFWTDFTLSLSYAGWGDKGGIQETSTDKLQETEVPIIQSSICLEEMDRTEGLDEDLILCAGGAGTGPCKVNH